MIAMANTENMVAPQDGCPNCGERDADGLVWREDESVECQRCGTVYRPGEREDG